MATKGNYVFEVPNNTLARLFLECIREYLNRTVYKIRVRGRHSNRRKLERNGVRLNVDRDVPLELAERLVVYIDRKPVINWQERVA